MDAKKLDETMDALDYLGGEFFLHFENFKEAEKDVSNMVFGGSCDAHLSAAIKCKMMFEDQIEQLKIAKLPFFGSKNLKIQIKNAIDHSTKNQLQMSIAINSIDKSFVDGAMVKLWLDYAK